MKSILLFFFSSILYYGAFAQIEDVSTQLDDPSFISIIDDQIYVSRYQKGEVRTRGVNEMDDVLFEPLATDLESAYGQAVLGDIMYIADPIGQAIYKTDLKNGNYVKILNTPNAQPVGLVIRKDPATGDDFLYYSIYEKGGEVYKLNISQTSSIPKVVLTDLGWAAGLAMRNDVMYIAEPKGNRILKLDFSASTLEAKTVYSNLEEPTSLLFYGDNLLIGEYSGGYISKVNVTDDLATPEILVPGLRGPSGLAVHEEYLYFGQYEVGKVSRFYIGAIVDTKNIEADAAYSIYPNPTNDFLYLDNWEWNGQSEAAEIISSNGSLIKRIELEASGRIDVSEMPSGFYFLKLGDKKPLKFVLH